MNRFTGKGKLHIRMIARRFVALFLVFSFLAVSVPMDVHAMGLLNSLIGGSSDDNSNQVTRNQESIDRETAAQKQKALLESNGVGNTAKCRLSTAKILAAATSEKIESYDMQIDAKTAKMQSAVRSLRERERSMQTIRWSPVFNGS